MAGEAVPLATLLSRALIAFTIEADNAFEAQVQHSTSLMKREPGVLRKGPWLVSVTMWTNVLAHIDDGGTTIEEFCRRTGWSREPAKRWLAVFGRWRYLHHDGALMRFSTGGQVCAAAWRPLLATTETNWERRFGPAPVEELREALRTIVTGLDPTLPGSMPILGYGLTARATPHLPRTLATMSLYALLSSVLLAFTLDYEREADFALAIGANVLRVLTTEGVRPRDLPVLTGVSKEAVAFGTGFLARSGAAVERPDPQANRGKLVALTATGSRSQAAYHRHVAAIERAWDVRFGERAIARVRTALETILNHAQNGRSVLADGLRAAPGGWRTQPPYAAQTKRLIADPIGALPHHPMVLHRGGWPDGS